MYGLKNTYFHVLSHWMDAKYLHEVMCLNTWCLVGGAVCEGPEVLRRQSLSRGRRPLGVGFSFFYSSTPLFFVPCSASPQPMQYGSKASWFWLLAFPNMVEHAALEQWAKIRLCLRLLLSGISSQQQKQNEGMLCCHKEEWVPMVSRTRAGSKEPHVTQIDSQWQVLCNFFRMWNLKTFS